MLSTRRLILGGLLVSPYLLAVPGAFAQEFPTRPVRLVVGFAAGGSIDAVARALADSMRQGLGQPVIVENKAGAGGRIAGAEVARGAADGHTMLMTGTTIGLEPILYKTSMYDPEKDLVPIGTAARSALVVVVPATSPYKTLNELLAAGKASGTLTYGSPGIGTPNHLAPAALSSKAGAKLTHIPYKGNSPAVNDLLGGQIHMMFTTIPAIQGHIQSGKLRALAISSGKRDPAMPDVQTLTELGIAMPELALNYGVMAPAATPAPVLARLRKDLQAALRTPAFREQLAKLGLEPMAGTPEEFTAILKREQGVYGEIIRTEKIQLE